MKKIYCSLLTLLFFVTGSFAQIVVAGADVGSNGTYATLGAAFTSINASSQSGLTITITVSGITTEPVSATLNQSIGPWTSLRIIPILNASITGNIAGPLINLKGADNIIIDGLNILGNSLAIDNSNTSAIACTIQFVDDASANTIINCSLLGASGSATSSGLGTIYFSSGLATGNDANTITRCNISSSASGNPVNAIFSTGTSVINDNSNNIISVNNISDYFNPVTTSCGVFLSQFNLGWTITNNTFYQTATRTATVGNPYYGINITSGIGYTITNNVIGFAAPNATGTTNIIGVSSGSLGGTFPGSFTNGSAVANAISFVGINCSFTGVNIFSSIQNNTIGGIAIYTSSAGTSTGVLCGIAVLSGNANIGNVTGNTIGSTTGTGSLYAASTTAGAVVSGIYCTSNNTIVIQNNKIGGINVSGTTATTAAGFKGIDVSGTGIFNVNNNNVGNATANNIRTGYLLTGANLSNTATTAIPASGPSNVRGIVSSITGTTLNITSNIVRGMQVSGTATNFTGIVNTGNPSTTININNNQVGNAGTGAVNFIAATTGTITGISNTGSGSASTINLNNNSIDGISCISTGQFMAVNNIGNTNVAINIDSNRLGTVTGTLVTFTGVQVSSLILINNSGGGGFTTVTIQGNDIRGIIHSVTGTANHEYIISQGTPFSAKVLGNTFTNLGVNTSGNVTFITRAGFMDYFTDWTCANNRIVTSFAKTAAGGQLKFYTSSGSHAEPVGMYITGNDFSNVTVTGATTIVGVSNLDSELYITCTGNIFNNITGGSGDITMIYTLSPTGIICSSNTISNVTGTGAITAISMEYVGNGLLFGSTTCGLNTISNLLSSGGGGDVKAIVSNPANSTTSIYSNNINGLSSTGSNANVMGIQDFIRGGTNIYGNVINNLSCSGTGAPVANGITVGGMFATYGSANVFYNKIYNVLQSGVIGSGSSVINGIALTTAGSGSVTAHNNFVADLKATNANLADAIRGISVNSITANMNYNLYYNSVYINAASTGTNFGSTGIYHFTNATATTARLNLIDNIIVNTSTANGTGVTAAYRRSDATLTNYAATSDNNLFYAGTPTATNLIYHDGTNSDQTLAAYQTRVSTRDANSISLMPVFVSAIDLHLTNANCQIDGRGKPVSVTTDIDGTTRNATAPDIGADEFTASYGPALAGVIASAVCDNRTVSAAGTYYATDVCSLIARVVPSGALPVAGKISACVTLDATSIPFNGEPYVQRHYDIEPVSSPATATATITLYFTNAEFMLYNSTNPVWPPLPTFAGDPNIANVKVTQFHGAPFGGLPTTTPGNYAGSRVLLNPVSVVLTGTVWAVTVNVAGFSGFYVHTNIWNAPLPIVVNYITGHKQGSNHLLNWKVTCTSTPRATMTLERSSDARNYTGIHTITADAARCQQPFDYTDANPLKGMNYYRLKIVDADGKITYSTTVALLNAVKGFDIISIAPNPVVDDNFKLNVASAVSGKMEIIIFDMQGRLVKRQTLSLISGFNSLPVNVANLAAGTYTIKGSMTDDQSKVIRFVKQ